LERHGETRTKILAAVPFEDSTTYSVTIFVGIYKGSIFWGITMGCVNMRQPFLLGTASANKRRGTWHLSENYSHVHHIFTTQIATLEGVYSMFRPTCLDPFQSWQWHDTLSHPHRNSDCCACFLGLALQ
jgi:hypothetical protein